MEMKSALHLGTSGWTYEHWKNVFYPPEISKAHWFEHFSSIFDTVELNASFYRIPTVKTVEGWDRRSPENFRFAVKMSRLVTHVKKLRNCEHELEWFFSVFEPLQKKIGIFLVQLPPSMKFNPALIRDFSELLPENARFAFEFRNSSWYNEETYGILGDLGHVFCIHDWDGIPTDRIVTSDTAYIRFHGYDSRYGGDYQEEILDNWAEWIRGLIKKGTTVYGYFNNDIGGFAVKNCLQLRARIL